MTEPTLNSSETTAFEPGDVLPPIEDVSQTGNIAAPPSRVKLLFSKIGWFGIGLGFFIFFTIVKMPDEQIKAYIQNTVASQLADSGITLTANETSLSLLLGLTYSMKQVTLSSQTGTPVKLDEIRVSPSFIPLLFGKLGASFKVSTAGGHVKGSVAFRKSQYDLSLKTTDFDVKKSKLLEALANFSAGALVTLDADISGDTLVPTETQGSITANINRLAIEPQTIFGFLIPQLAISESTVDILIDKGKTQIKTLRLGKEGLKSEDIFATVTGSLTLARRIEMSNLSVKAKFGFSEKVMRAFILLDTLLAAGKQSDGSYSFQLDGLLSSPSYTPVAP